MKKSTIGVLTVFIVLLTCLLVPVVSAENREPIREKENITTLDRLYNIDDYMNIDNPKIMDKSENTLVVANDSDIYINTNGEDKLYKNVIPKDKQGYKIYQLVIIESNLLVLLGNDISNELYISNLSNINNLVLAQEQNEKPLPDIYSISRADKKLALINNTSINYYTIENDKLVESTKENINIGKNNTNIAKIFDNTLYFLMKNNPDVIYKIESNELKTIYQKENITDFSILGNNLYTIENNTINKIDLTTNKTTTKSIEGTLSSIFSENSSVYVTISSQNRLVIYDEKLEKEVNYYGSSGNELDRYNAPMSITYYENKVYIADSNNNRIIEQDTTNNSRKEIKTNGISPIDVVVNDSYIYIVGIDKNIKNIYYSVKSYNNAPQFTKIDGYSNIIDIERHNENVLILTNSGITVYNGKEKIGEIKLQDAVDIIVPYGTNKLYAITNQNIIKYDLETLKEDSKYNSPNINGLHNIDYFGNLYITTNTSITKYKLENKNYVKTDMPNEYNYTLGSEIFCFLNTYNGDMYISDKNSHLCYIVKSEDIGSMSILNGAYEHPKDYDILKLGVVNSENAVALATPKNMESARSLEKNEKVLVLAIVEDSYYYVTYEDKDIKEYIKKECIDLHEYIDKENSQMSPMLNNTKVYMYPYTNADIVATIGPKDIVSVSYQIADSKLWNWYKITYHDNKVGYVKAQELAPITPTTPPQNIEFLKTKCNKLGEKIIMYKEPNENSEIIFDNIDDGVDVQTFSNFDKNSEFTKVLYNGKVGYIKTINLQTSGLTPNQIIAISVTCSIAGLFVIIIVILYFIKKNKSKKSKVEYQILE